MESLIEIINGQDDTTSGDLELIIDITMRAVTIGISKSIYVSTITIHTASTMDPNYLRPPVNAPVNAPSYQCLQSMYRVCPGTEFYMRKR
eukprot:scaffold65461_cov92-Cyclotella_meneghiniana.AAC.1